jgi:peptide/nickel transport system permease protein
MLLLKFIARRLLYFVPQLLGVTVLAFVLVRLAPGDPALRLSGGMATDSQLAGIRERLGLTGSLFHQFKDYLGDALRGDFGTAFFTSRPVREDLLQRLPATLELITISLMISIGVSLIVGMFGALGRARRTGRIVNRGIKGYGFFAGALPDFWVGILLIYLFFVTLGIAPGPTGQVDFLIDPVQRRTGSLLIDSLLAGRLDAFRSHVAHLVLPVATLVFVYSGNILKITAVSLEEALVSPSVRYARASGLGPLRTVRSALRQALAPLITISGIAFTFLLGGAVLVETVFSWGGVGQYAVQAVVNSDFPALQGFLIAATMFSLVVFLVVDILYFVANPRVKAQ